MENMRNIIRLKDVPSNIIEEAIIIFKENKKAKKLEYSNKFNNVTGDKSESKQYIIKEAELIISDYLNESENVEDILIKKNKHLKIFSACLLGLLFLSIIF